MFDASKITLQTLNKSLGDSQENLKKDPKPLRQLRQVKKSGGRDGGPRVGWGNFCDTVTQLWGSSSIRAKVTNPSQVLRQGPKAARDLRISGGF